MEFSALKGPRCSKMIFLDAEKMPDLSKELPRRWVFYSGFLGNRLWKEYWHAESLLRK
jgi:hypothetical protein